MIGFRANRSWNTHLLAAVAAVALTEPAFPAGTPANTTIVNEANATYRVNGFEGSANSNTSTLLVDERLDVVAVSNDAPGVTVPTPGNDRVRRFTVTNTGNGSEAFLLAINGAIAGDQFDPADLRLFLDSNGNGVFDAGVDMAYVAGGNDPVLNADDSVTLFVIGNTAANLLNADTGLVELTAVARTGNGTPGTSFPGLGDGGTTAVVGASGARAPALGRYLVAGTDATLIKSQLVLDPSGGSNPVPGAVITYTLILTVNDGDISNALITDPIPINTNYLAGSLRLNGAPLTDALDGDAGLFAATLAVDGLNSLPITPAVAGITVNLGNVAAPAIHTIQFSVLIN